MAIDPFDEVLDQLDKGNEKDRESREVTTEPQDPRASWDDNERRVELPSPTDLLESAKRQPGEVETPKAFMREVTASAPMDLARVDPNAKGPWIQYNGQATVRIITPHDWKQAGVDSNKYCEWNYLNSKRLPRSMFSDEELQYLLRVDGRFSLETK